MTEDDDFSLEGGCTCRAVRYRLTRTPMFVHRCHCRWCQRETGTAFALNAIVEAEAVVLLAGTPETVDTPSPSGQGQKIHRCPTCRIAVWSNYAGSGDAIRFLRVGTLDDPDRVAPDIHIYTSSKQPWVPLPADTPAVEAYYDRDDYWPEASLERRRAVVEWGVGLRQPENPRPTGGTTDRSSMGINGRQNRLNLAIKEV